MCNRQLKIDPERQSITEKIPEPHTIDPGSFPPIFGVAYSRSRSSLQTAPIRPVFLSLKRPVPYSETKTETSEKTTSKTLETGRSTEHHFRETGPGLDLDSSFWGTLGDTVNRCAIASSKLIQNANPLQKKYQNLIPSIQAHFPPYLV